MTTFEDRRAAWQVRADELKTMPNEERFEAIKATILKGLGGERERVRRTGVEGIRYLDDLLAEDIEDPLLERILNLKAAIGEQIFHLQGIPGWNHPIPKMEDA